MVWGRSTGTDFKIPPHQVSDSERAELGNWAQLRGPHTVSAHHGEQRETGGNWMWGRSAPPPAAVPTGALSEWANAFSVTFRSTRIF